MEYTETEIREQIEIVKNIKQDIDIYKNIDVGNGYLKTVRKIKTRSGKLLFIHIFNKAAAILIIPLLISVAYLLSIVDRDAEVPQNMLYTKITAAPGTVIQTELPDKSTVWLNSGSTLRYPSHFFGDRRKVELVGEGFFDVQTNPDMPFEVTTPSGLQAIAHGTEFDISAYPDDSSEDIVLKEGVVEIIYKNQNIIMKPDNMISLRRDDLSLKKSNVNVEEKTAWVHGRMIFRNSSLEEVMKKLSRRYNVEIALHKENKVDYRIRASFSNETITQIMDYLKIAAPITWSMSDIEQNTDATFSKQKINVQVK